MSQVNKIKKVLKHSVKETYDSQTGELQLQEEVTAYSVSSEPAFVKLYLDGIQAIYKLNSSNHAVLNELLKITNYGGEIILNPAVKKRICAFLNTSVGTFDNTLLTLKRADIIRQKDRGCYMVNPELFGKGPWSEVYKDRAKYKKIKMTIEYSGTKQARKTIRTEILNDDEAILVEANRRGITSDELLAEVNIDDLGLDLDAPSPFDFEDCEVE
jgi:hypothetical protein